MLVAAYKIFRDLFIYFCRKSRDLLTDLAVMRRFFGADLEYAVFCLKFRPLWSPNLYNSLVTLYSAPSVWLLILLLIAASLLPDLVLRVFTDTFSIVYRYRRRVSVFYERIVSEKTTFLRRMRVFARN